MNMFCKPILGTGLAPAFVFIVLLSLPAVQVSAAEAISRPNIIVIMADDLDTASLRAALELQSPEFPDGLMPHLKRFVVEPGVEFAESFVTFPLCCPSRATYLTGLYPHNHNVLGNLPPAGGFYRFDDTSTIATWLLAGGYRTGHIGKYLNGYQDATYVPPGWSDWYSLVGPTTYCMYDYTISSNGVPQYYHDAEEDYQTDVLAAYAEGFIHDVDSFDDIQPFFLSVTPLAPHLESYCNYNDIRAAPRHEGSVNLEMPVYPSTNEEDMSDKPEWMRSLDKVDLERVGTVYNHRLAAMRAVDDMIGRIETALRETGEIENTVVIFTSDNGYLLGQHRWIKKTLVYEEAIRVPLYLRAPVPGMPATVSGIVLNNDLAPTIADLAEVTPWLPVDGRSLLPLLSPGSVPWRKRFLIEHPPVGSPFGVPPYLAVRQTRLSDQRAAVYAETLSGDGVLTDAELYDLTTDPYQLESLHADPSWRRVRLILRTHLEALKECGLGTCQILEDRNGW